MKLKVTKHLTYARKLYDQQPEFTFAKVGSGRPDQNSLHSKKCSRVQNHKVQKLRHQIQFLNLHHRQPPVHNRKLDCKRNTIRHQVNRRQDKQTNKNKQTKTNKQTYLRRYVVIICFG